MTDLNDRLLRAETRPRGNGGTRKRNGFSEAKLLEFAELLFFAIFDPFDLHVFGKPVEADRMSIYTLGFLFFWAVATAASVLTVFLQRSPFDVNRDAANTAARPPGSSERDVADV